MRIERMPSIDGAATRMHGPRITDICDPQCTHAAGPTRHLAGIDATGLCDRLLGRMLLRC